MADRDRPVGMLPLGLAQQEATEEDRELVLDLAESIYPEVQHYTQLNKSEQKFWLSLALSVLRGTYFSRLSTKFGEVLTPGVNAEIEDLTERRKFDLANKERRIDLDVQERDQRDRHREQKREEEHRKNDQKIRIFGDEWEVRKLEQLTNLANRSLREKVVLGMAVVVFLLALVFCVLGLLSHRSYVGGSGGGLAVLVLGILFRQVRHDQKQGMVEMRSHESSRQQDGHDSG